MSSVVISGDTSGAITISAPAIAGTNTLTLPTSTGNVVVDVATQTLTNKTLTSPILGTPTSGTLTNCTGLPTSGIAATAWTSYTPVITASTGSFTTVSATGAYQVIGKTCFVSINITITTVGSASGLIYATLPFTSAARIQIGGWGMETSSTGNMLKGYIPTSSTQLQWTTYSNGFTIGAGYTPTMNVVYEIA